MIPCGSLQAMVLGDEPLPSAFVRFGSGLAIVRWVHCASRPQAIEAISSLPTVMPVVDRERAFIIDQPSLCMFDAAHDGTSAASGGCICIDVAPGRYDVTTELYRMAGEFEFLIHRLRSPAAAA